MIGTQSNLGRFELDKRIQLDQFMLKSCLD